MSEKEAGIEVEGTVREELAGGNYRVELDNKHSVLAYASGKMRKFRIPILPGDRVKLELSPYDLTRGRLTYRQKQRPLAPGTSPTSAPRAPPARSAPPDCRSALPGAPPPRG